MKSKWTAFILSVALVANAALFVVPSGAHAEDATPQAAGSVYDDLKGDYGLLGIASQFSIFTKGKHRYRPIRMGTWQQPS